MFYCTNCYKRLLHALSRGCKLTQPKNQLTAAQLTNLNNFKGYLAASGPLTLSLDWTEHSKVVDLSKLEAHALSHNNPNLHECPFILDKWVPVAPPRLVNGHYSLWLCHS